MCDDCSPGVVCYEEDDIQHTGDIYTVVFYRRRIKHKTLTAPLLRNARSGEAVYCILHAELYACSSRAIIKKD